MTSATEFIDEPDAIRNEAVDNGLLMTDNRTTELLCKLLEERGLSYQTDYLHVAWRVGSKLYDAMNNLDGTLTVDNLTPEQAIAATLGSEREKALEELVQDVWAVYSAKAESSFHPAWEVDSELARRMAAFGFEVIDE